MLPTRPAVPSIRTILRCRPSISRSLLHCPKKSQIPLRRNISNHGIPPQVPPQYFPQPPQYFPQQLEEPPSTNSNYLWTAFVFLLGAFVGHNIEQEPFTGKWTFICVPTDLYIRLGEADYRVRRARIERWAEKYGLGKIEGMPIVEGDKDFDSGGDAKVIYPEDVEAMRTEHQLNPTQDLERELAINDMFSIISRLLQYANLNTRWWGFGFWHATDGDYSKFAEEVPLIKMFCNGRAIMHVDTLKLLGSEDYFAFAAARNIADAAVFHEAERLTAIGLSFALPAIMFFLTRKQSFGRRVSRTLISYWAMELGFRRWIYRRAERANDEISLSMLVTCGFDPKAAIGALRKIEEIQKANSLPASSALEWLGTQPSIANRIKNLESLLPAAIAQQEELKKALETFAKLTAQQQDGQQFDGPEKLPSLDEEKKNDDESESG